MLLDLIDLHAHPANSGSVFGVPPDEHIVSHGTTTVLSQGDAGASIIDQYVDETISASKTRVLLAINLSRNGESTSHGCFENLDDADVNACTQAIDRYREFIPAVAVNVSHYACGNTDPREVMSRGIEITISHNWITFGCRIISSRKLKCSGAIPNKCRECATLSLGLSLLLFRIYGRRQYACKCGSNGKQDKWGGKKSEKITTRSARKSLLKWDRVAEMHERPE